ncbi:hypothetical protein KKC13_01900 [bacterium]|nr:hypothetical protein [bacterium]MBU1957629.1 hypothetical protein [bacterium]
MISAGRDKYRVNLQHLAIGQDILVIITGGKEHIGGLSLAENDSCSTLSKKGHKESLITKSVAPMIQSTLNRDVLVVCGIHIDNATANEIKILVTNTQTCVNIFLKEIDD